MVYIKHLSHLIQDVEATTLVNTSGRKLLTVCSSHRLESANGQIPGDKRGFHEGCFFPLGFFKVLFQNNFY